MFKRRVKGKTDRALYEVAVDVPETSTQIVFGVLLGGTCTGQIWMEDVSLSIE